MHNHNVRAVASLAWIIAATLLGAVLAVLAAALAGRARPGQVSLLISYAIGTLLGAVFLEILPHALARSADAAVVTGTVLAGVLLFFMLEKLMLWRHRHDADLAGHEDGPRSQGRAATMVFVGDTFRNFVDGIIIASAFAGSIALGIVTALALITHEIPQQIGDFLVVRRSGYSRRSALGLSLLSGAVMMVGGVLGYYALQATPTGAPLLLSLAAGSMLYVSVADLIPGLIRRHELSATVQQALLIVAGVGTILAVGQVIRSLTGG